MENWYTEWENALECIPEELIIKAEEKDDEKIAKICKHKERECTQIRNRRYRRNFLNKLYISHFKVNEDNEELNTVVFSYTHPNYYIPDLDNKPRYVKRITGEHNYFCMSGEKWKKIKKSTTNRRIRYDNIDAEMPSKNRKYITSRFRHTFD